MVKKSQLYPKFFWIRIIKFRMEVLNNTYLIGFRLADKYSHTAKLENPLIKRCWVTQTDIA
jgi:hypothetical protein